MDRRTPLKARLAAAIKRAEALLDYAALKEPLSSGKPFPTKREEFLIASAELNHLRKELEEVREMRFK
jgi:hypothetical protein